jgi:hypothetical protein
MGETYLTQFELDDDMFLIVNPLTNHGANGTIGTLVYY